MGCSLLLITVANAQQKEGRVVYERTMQLQLRMAGMGSDVEQVIPRTRVDKIEVLFANNQSLRRQVPEEAPADETVSDGPGGGIQIRVFNGQADDVTYNNFSEGKLVEKREFAARKYIISDSIRRMNWKLTGETKTILGFVCQQAISQRISVRTMTTMDNGQMKTEKVPDTSNITAWFAPSIPVSAGPEYQGQLPGLILAIDINNGRTVYKAIEVSPKADIASIKEPKGGKKVTPDEFAKERDAAMEEMRKNNTGRGRTIQLAN